MHALQTDRTEVVESIKRLGGFFLEIYMGFSVELGLYFGSIALVEHFLYYFDQDLQGLSLAFVVALQVLKVEDLGQVLDLSLLIHQTLHLPNLLELLLRLQGGKPHQCRKITKGIAEGVYHFGEADILEVSVTHLVEYSL